MVIECSSAIILHSTRACEIVQHIYALHTELEINFSVFLLLGVLPDIQDSFNISDDKGGLLQTVFIISYMIFAPIFGYLGDRFSRKAIMAFGITLWGLTTLLGSYMNSFGWFVFFRALVGIGEASYSTIAPTILSDLFIHDLRSKMLAVFYFAIPVGSGLG